MKKLTIGHVVWHSCMRVHKVSRVLKARGHKQVLVTSGILPIHDYRHYDVIAHTPHTWGSQSLIPIIQMLDDKVDVWHCHNEPDGHTTVVKRVSKKPVIHDCHDLASLRSGDFPDEDELAATLNADAILAAGTGQANILARRFPEKIVRDYPPAVPLNWYPPTSSVKRPGLIMPTGLRTEAGNYRNWVEGFNKIHSLGIPLLCYNGTVQYNEYYRQMCKAQVLDPIKYHNMLEMVSMTEAGFFGAAHRNPLCDVSVPNKMWEYIAAGIPAIVYQAKEPGEFVQENNIGVVVESLDEIPEALKMIKKNKLREHCQRVRHKFSMENFIDRIESLYYELQGETV